MMVRLNALKSSEHKTVRTWCSRTMRYELCDGTRRGCSSSIGLADEGVGSRTRRRNVRVPQRACRRKRCRCSSLFKWASENACGASGGGFSFSRGVDDGVVAGIGRIEGSQYSTMRMAPGAVGSGLKRQAYRRRGCRGR